MPNHHLAQINIARMLAPIDDPVMADFVANLPSINVVEQSPGFVWRRNRMAVMQRDYVYDDEMIIIKYCLGKSGCVALIRLQKRSLWILRDRKRWFEIRRSRIAMWWICVVILPRRKSPRNALNISASMAILPFAFSFKKVFPEPEPPSLE
jgi:hypothetical protein